MTDKDVPNVLTGRIRPGYNSLIEYLRAGGGNGTGTTLTLEEFGHLLGSDGFFRVDADRIMGFYNKLGVGLKTQELRILPVPEGGNSPKFELNSPIYNHVSINVFPCWFPKMAHEVVGIVEVKSNRFNFHENAFNNERCDALKEAFRKIKEQTKIDSLLKSSLDLWRDPKSGDFYQGRVSLERYSANGGKIPYGLDELADRTIRVVQGIEALYRATDHINKLREQDVNSAASAIVQAAQI